MPLISAQSCPFVTTRLWSESLFRAVAFYRGKGGKHSFGKLLLTSEKDRENANQASATSGIFLEQKSLKEELFSSPNKRHLFSKLLAKRNILFQEANEVG